MTASWSQITGGDIAVVSGVAVDHYHLKGLPDSVPSGDYFSHVASLALDQIPAQKHIPALGGALYLQDIQIHELAYARLYRCQAPYGRLRRQVGAYQINVSQVGASVHVLAGTRISGWGPDGGGNTVAEGDTPGEGDEPTNNTGKRDNGGLIGVDGDYVHGTDVPIPKTELTILFRHPAGVLDREYIRRTGKLNGKVNNDEFLGFEPGEVLYRGGNYGESPVEATAQYHFSVEYNTVESDNLMVGGIHVKEKKGWDIISPVYADEPKDGVRVKEVKYVEVIRPAGMEDRDFAAENGFGWGASGDDE